MSASRDLKKTSDPAMARSQDVADIPQGVTLRGLCEVLWAAESRFGLLEWEASGVRPWLAGRFAVFQRLTSALGLFDNIPEEIPTGWLGRIGFHARLIRGSLSHNPFLPAGGYDALIFEAPRSSRIGATRGCVYTNGVANELSEQGKRVLLLDTHLAGAHSKSRDPRRRFTDAVGLESGFRFRTSTWIPNREDLALLRRVEEFLKTQLPVETSLGWLLVPGVPRFLASYRAHQRLFRRHQPSEVYCVCAYGNLAPLVAAAQDLGIRVTEIQHAAISEHHLGYSYPGRAQSNRPAYFPDRFLAWNCHWNRCVSLPCEVVPIPPNWEDLTKAHRGIPKKPGLVVVLSQPTIARRLAVALKERIRQLQRFEIVIKLHPAEVRDATLREVYEVLACQPNITISGGENLYSLLSRAQYQIGVYSTALYQGLDLSCRTLLVPLPGMEFMEHLLGDGTAELLDDFLAAEGQSSLQGI